MKTLCVAVLTAVLLAGCGAPGSPTAIKGLPGLKGGFTALERPAHHEPILSKPAQGLTKHARPMPEPDAPTQGLTKKDVSSVAGAAYAQAFKAKTPTEVQQIAKLALEKIKSSIGKESKLQAVVKFAQQLINKSEVSDPEDGRRLALWPLHFLKQGCSGTDDPMFFEMNAMLLESMLNWQDGLAVGLVALDLLEDHPDGYVKTMVAKAATQFRNPKIGLEDSYKITLATFKEIQATLLVLK